MSFCKLKSSSASSPQWNLFQKCTEKLWKYFMLAIDILRGEMCTLKKKNQKTLSFTSLATTQSIIILGLITITEKKS